MSSSKKNFQKNVNFYARTAPQIALRMPYYNCQNILLCQTGKGEVNLRKPLDGKWRYFHSTEDAQKEAKDWFSSLDLRKKEILYVYGMGLGYYYDAASKWLKKDEKRHLIFLEQDMGVLCRLFETDRGSQILRDKQVSIHFLQGMGHDKLLFERLSWIFIGQQVEVSALKLYAKEHSERFLELRHHIPYDAAVYNELIDEYRTYGMAFFRNFYPNMLELPKSLIGNRLFDKFQGVPAIICGAGPSLGKQLPLLKSYANRALLFSGGSSLNALIHGEIIPHFGVGIDPNDEQYNRLKATADYPIPFFYRNRMNHKAFNLIKGPRLYLTGAGGYDIANWFEEKLKIKGKLLDEGHNVINLCTEIAYALGCNPIIFVGMDLAYTDMKLYAPGVLQKSRSKASSIAAIDHSKLFQRKNIYGKNVYTEWKWVAESDWISKFSKEHSDITLINATEGGIGFVGVPNKSLQEVSKTFLKKKFDIKRLIGMGIEKGRMKGVTHKKIIKVMQELAESLERCRDYLDILLQEGELRRKQYRGKGNVFVSQMGQAALAEYDLVEEVGYRAVLDIFNTMFHRINYREFHELERISKKGTSKKYELKKVEIDCQRYSFLQTTALVNLYLLESAFKRG